MNRLALNKTTRPLLYDAMGSGIILALLPLALVLGTSPAQAMTHTVTFSVPITITTPAQACVAVNGERKCSPVVDQVVVATISATLSEAESLYVTDGAPSFTNCDLLAKTVAFGMQADDTARITVTGTSPPIDQTISSGPVGSPPTTVEVCIGSR
jgi:hypothetical protein